LQQAQRVLKPGGILFVGNYNSDGIMLSHLLSGVEAHSWNQGASQWALGALARGEQADGNPSFITVAGAAEMCGRFGFELAVIKPDREFYPYDVEAHGRESHGRGPDTTSSRAQFLQGYVSAVSLVARKERGWRTAGRRLSAAPFRSRLKRLARRVLRGR
jgi:hypothetical protein